MNPNSIELREITTGLAFPEGPVAMPDGSCLVVEIRKGCLTRIWPDGGKEIVAEPGGGPNGAAIGPDGRCYICNNGGFEWADTAIGTRPVAQASDYSGGRIEAIDLETGEIEVLYTESDGHQLRGPNDIVFDSGGGFWFTDLGKIRARDMDRGRVLYATPDGSTISEVCYPMVMPNGIGLSPAEDRLYVAETEAGRLWEFDITAPGSIRREPWPSPHGGRFLTGVSRYRRFDSLAVEEGGNICVATLIEGGITVVAPDGSRADHIPMPDMYSTNICFGGPERRTAYITLSESGRLVACDWPRPGLALNFLAPFTG